MDQNGLERNLLHAGTRIFQYASNPGLLDRIEAWSEMLDPVTLGTGPDQNVSRFRGGGEVQTSSTCGPAEDQNGPDRLCAEHYQIGPDRTGPEQYIPVFGIHYI